uniref:Uncharacterized protein n=1 Tax=Pristionchus pacificus TaxID=54126 RepID=A0A2A6CFQ3_PRIPA|eukprot:PDM76936.1 hypothetical protein PRIPAC_42331 [Pristionchus pacificus]
MDAKSTKTLVTESRKSWQIETELLLWATFLNGREKQAKRRQGNPISNPRWGFGRDRFRRSGSTSIYETWNPGNSVFIEEEKK